MNRIRIALLIAGFAFQGSSAWAQGTFGHIAVGGGWHMTITLVNLLPSATTAQVTFFSDNGSALVVGAAGQTANSQYSLNLPATGSATLTLPDSGPLLSGWAKVTASNSGVLRGQADFVYHPAGLTGRASSHSLPTWHRRATAFSRCRFRLRAPSRFRSIRRRAHWSGWPFPTSLLRNSRSPSCLWIRTIPRL